MPTGPLSNPGGNSKRPSTSRWLIHGASGRQEGEHLVMRGNIRLQSCPAAFQPADGVIGNKKGNMPAWPTGGIAFAPIDLLRDRLRAQKRNSVKPNGGTLWRSAMCAETITTNHFKLLQREKLEPLNAECAIDMLAPTCPHCNCKVVGHGVEAGDQIYLASIAPRNPVCRLKDRS